MAELERLHAAGVRGARIMDLPGGAIGLDRLGEVNARVSGLGWCIAVQFDGSHMLEHLPMLERIEGRYIIDHHGKFFCGVTPDDPARLVTRDASWRTCLTAGMCGWRPMSSAARRRSTGSTRRRASGRAKRPWPRGKRHSEHRATATGCCR